MWHSGRPSMTASRRMRSKHASAACWTSGRIWRLISRASTRRAPASARTARHRPRARPWSRLSELPSFGSSLRYSARRSTRCCPAATRGSTTRRCTAPFERSAESRCRVDSVTTSRRARRRGGRIYRVPFHVGSHRLWRSSSTTSGDGAAGGATRKHAELAPQRVAAA